MEQPNPATASPAQQSSESKQTVKATRKSVPAKTAKPAKQPSSEKKTAAKAIKPDRQTKAPSERPVRPGDYSFEVTLQPRHAAWVELRARQSGRTAASMLEKIVREGYAADPNNKAGATTNNAQLIDEVAEQNRA